MIFVYDQTSQRIGHSASFAMASKYAELVDITNGELFLARVKDLHHMSPDTNFYLTKLTKKEAQDQRNKKYSFVERLLLGPFY